MNFSFCVWTTDRIVCSEGKFILENLHLTSHLVFSENDHRVDFLGAVDMQCYQLKIFRGTKFGNKFTFLNFSDIFQMLYLLPASINCSFQF